MRKLALAVSLAFTGLAAARFGGWAIISIDSIPEHGTVGRPVVFDFTVRQHGDNLLEGLQPTLVAKSGSDVVTGRAWETSSTGVYRASIDLPESGDWAMTIQSGFGPSELKLLPLKVVGAMDRVAAMQPAERGRQLFAAKGCVSCHVHRSVGITPFMKDVAPDLSDKRFAAEYLQKFLANPSIKPKSPNMTEMPNMRLRPGEIASLVAFINAEQRVTSR